MAGEARAIEFVVSEAAPADATAIAALLQCAFAEFEALYTPEAFVATVPPESGILTRLEDGPLWVAVRESAVIGTVGAVYLTGSVLVRGMAVHPSARGLGAGKCLLDQVERFAKQKGARMLALYTTAFLNQAIRVYKAAGFTFTGEKASPHGTELLRMVKALVP
jgi:GNAT superfamily N-acetyltransferase